MRLGTALTWIITVVVVSLLQEYTTGQLQSKPVTRPEFNLTVNESSKSVTVYVESLNKVKARWCYRIKSNFCDGGKNKPVTIVPSLSRSAVFHVPYFLKCLCVEVFNTDLSKRHTNCPLENSTLSDVNDFWNSTTVKLKTDSLTLVSKCPAADIKVSTALCWKHDHHCTVVFNLSLVETVDALKREYNTSAVDKHPQMCVQRSLQGSHNITCPFEADMSSWRVHTELGRQSVFVYINSTVPAKFSVQLCKLRQTICASIGQIHSLNITIVTFQLPVLLTEERPCVQVWQSEPALHGKRILCPDYTHNRYGIYAVAALVCVVIVVSLGLCFHHLTKRGTAGWLYIQRPVLLVCSSEDSAHVSTVCSLASILQGDLGATVHLALWAQSTQSQYGTGVADLGPLPWLYGQWDTVIKAQGSVLIIWSPEAKIAYNKWWREKEKNKSANHKYFYSQKPHKTDETVKLTAKYKLKKAEKHTTQVTQATEPCTVIAPVFKAALTCLMGALQANRGQQVAFVFLQGQGNSKDIPKVFRGVPRYCLPREFSGLIQELGVKTRLAKNSKLDCRTRLLSKVLSFWLAKQLSRRLQTLLPQK